MDTALLPLAFALLGLVTSAQAHSDRDPFDIQLHLQIDRSIARRVLLADLQDEVERIWRPYGVHITWSDANSQTEPFPLRVVLASQIEGPGALAGPLVLGRAFVELNPRPTRPIRVSFDSTEQTLALRPNSWTSIAGHLHERELARALGRVLAHEIGHVLLAFRSHEHTGLMR